MIDPKAMATMYGPQEIEDLSLAIIDSEVPEPRPFQGGEWEVVRRMIHTSADFELLSLVRFHPKAVQAGVDALAKGCLLLTDTDMARKGIPLRRMEPLGCRVQSLMGWPGAADSAKEQGLTRAAAAMRMAMDNLAGGIAVIGNAPTALAMLLALLGEGGSGPALRPALIIGMCVGFVNAAEAKELLLAQDQVPYIAIQGRKGGSALAAGAVNALAEMALRRKSQGHGVQEGGASG